MYVTLVGGGNGAFIDLALGASANLFYIIHKFWHENL